MKKKTMTNFLLAMMTSLGIHGVAHTAEDFYNDCCTRPGDPLDLCCSNAIYPIPSKLDVCWDIYARGSFLYWSGAVADYSTVFKIDPSGQDLTQLYEKSRYKPGFEVGFGVDLGPFVLDFNYLRMHYSHTTHFSANNGSILEPISTQTSVGLVNFPVYTRAAFGFIENWDDILISLRVPTYFSKRLIFTIAYELDVQFAKNEWHRNYSNPLIPANVGNFKHVMKYWGVGPGVGLDFVALMGCGFKFVGDLDMRMDLLWFTKLDSTNFFPGAVPDFIANFDQRNKKKLLQMSPLMIADIGIGWQSEPICGLVYVDLVVAYEWVNRLFPPHALESVLYADSYFHGLKIQARVDF